MSTAAKGLIRGHNAGAMAAFERAAVGQERRRGFYSFLTWPFLLGIAFASDDIAALTHTGGPQDDGPSSHPADDPQSPPADASIDPVALSDWEPGGPQQISQELLPGPHFPDAITFGGLDGPAVIPEPENHPALLGGGAGGGGSGGELTGTAAVLPVDILAHPDALLAANGLGSDGLLDLRFGLEPVSNLLNAAGDTVNALMGELGTLPVVGGLLTDAGHLVSSLLGSSEPGSDAIGTSEGNLGSSILGGAVVASGTIAFGAHPVGSAIPQLFINGSYTDFGVAMASTAVPAPGLSSLIDHLDAGATLVDLGRLVDHGDHGTTPLQLNDDHILRTPLDLLG